MGHKASLFKGCLCGIAISLIINTTIILLFFIEMTTFLLYLVSLISGFITLLLFITNRLKAFIISLVVSILVFFTAEIIIGQTGIIRIFFQLKHGINNEMWAGDGIGMLIVSMFCLAGCAVGTIGAFIVTIIRISKRKNLNNAL